MKENTSKKDWLNSHLANLTRVSKFKCVKGKRKEKKN